MSASERADRDVIGPPTRSPHRHVRALPGGIAAVAVTLLLWMQSGALGLVGGGVLLAAWAVLPATYAFAIGQIAVVAAIRPETLPDTGLLAPLLIEIGLIGVLVGPVVRSTRGRRVAGWTLLGTVVLGGIALGSYALWEQVWIAATVLVCLGALFAYGLHRYELVVLGKVPDPDDDIGPGSELDSDGNVPDPADPDDGVGLADGSDPADDGLSADDTITPSDDGLDPDHDRLDRDDSLDSNEEGEAT